MKIYLDPGHGGSDSGALGHGLKEKDIVLKLAKQMKVHLQAYQHVQIKMSRSSDVTKSLTERTDEANDWGADLFLSIHCNAFNGKVSGYEDFIFNGLKRNSKAATFQRLLHEQVSKQIGLPNRGMKQANFHVLRETGMPAILTENGFIDHPTDSTLMKSNHWIEKVARAHVTGIAQMFLLQKKASEKVTYDVISGSFLDYANAEARQKFLEKHQINAVIVPIILQGEKMYRVQAGSFPTKQLARKSMRQIEATGVNAFILQSKQ